MGDKFCILPFVHFNVYPDDKIKPCCYSQSFFKNVNLKETSIVEAFNSDEYKKLRKDLLNGIEHSFCDVCWKTEKNGGESQRVKWNNVHSNIVDEIKTKTDKEGYINPDFISLDLRPSNVCNFKCRTCTPDFSTTWIDERYDFNKLMGVEQNKRKTQIPTFNIPNSNLENLNHLYFAGGEPLYMDDMYVFLNKLKNKEKISLYFNTNFSILKHKNISVFDLFKDFKNVHFGISCDGYGSIGEYVRTNFNWEKFCKNVYELGDAINKHGRNFSYGFQYTCSLLNCFHFFDFRRELYDLKFISVDEQLQFGFAEYPFWLNPGNFDLKWGVIDYFQENIDDIGFPGLKTEIENYMVYLKKHTTTHPEALLYLKNFINFSDNYNGTQLPRQLNYIKKYLKDDTEHTI